MNDNAINSICDFPVGRGARVAPVLVLWHASISPAGTPVLHRDFSSLAPVLDEDQFWRTVLTGTSGAFSVTICLYFRVDLV